MTRKTTSTPNPNVAELALSMAMINKLLDELSVSVADKVSMLVVITPDYQDGRQYVYRIESSKATIISTEYIPIQIIPTAICNDGKANPLLGRCVNFFYLTGMFKGVIVRLPACEEFEGRKNMSNKLKEFCKIVWQSRLLRKIFNYMLSKLVFKIVIAVIDFIIS